MSSDILKCLEETFGKIPEIISGNLKYLTYDKTNDEFFCEPCEKIIRLVPGNRDSTTINFEQHLQSNGHNNISVTVNVLTKRLNETFSGQIPVVVKNNIEVLGLSGTTYECVICNKYLQVGSHWSVTERNFLYHLMSATHEEKLEEFRLNIDLLMDIYGGIINLILNNRQFLKLTRSGKNYSCTICDQLIIVDSDDVENTEHNFENHLQSYEHKQNAKQENAFIRVPELKQGFNHLPNYILRNISYLSTNNTNGICSFFCSLCQISIVFKPHDWYQIEQNLKYHLLSQLHMENLSNRRDLDNETFEKLHELFDDFPNDTVDQLKYLSLDEDQFYCSICEESILEGDDNDETCNNVISHFESTSHSDEIDNEMDSMLEIHEELIDIFGDVPDFIKENMFHIEFRGGNDFKCLLCDKTLKSKSNDDFETNVSVTTNNFSNHLNSQRHREEVINLRQIDIQVINDLQELCTPIPQYIMNNLKHIGYEEDGDNFYCYTCSKTIYIVPGTKKEELTLLSIRNHIFSVYHTTKIKEESNRQLVATNQLMSIFGCIPKFVLNNRRYIERRDDCFQCNLCDAEIQEGIHSGTTKDNFLKHFSGNRHISNERDIEDLNTQAWESFDNCFSRVPEFLLRELDFFAYEESGLFCLLCQKKIQIYEDDLDFTKMIVRSHIYSACHKDHLALM